MVEETFRVDLCKRISFFSFCFKSTLRPIESVGTYESHLGTPAVEKVLSGEGVKQILKM